LSKCKKCYVDYTRNRSRNNKNELIKYKGEKCIICGYNRCNDALDFHHLNSKNKEKQISYAKRWNIEKAKKEADKCILVCNRCHKEIHAGLIKYD